MREIRVHLRFITPCLGRVRRDDCDLFERDADGNVIFMNSWWRSVFEYGARAHGKHQRDMAKIRVHPRIEGESSRYRRYYSIDAFKFHEAFLAKSIIKVRIMLPDVIPLDTFQEILSLAGNYHGISPYGWKEGFGQFEVLECETL
jgi:hypothetical protein